MLKLAEEIRERLHPDLVLFLESIMMSEETFFVFVEGINDPSDMLKGADLMPDEVEGDEDQFIVLYSTNIGLGEHGVGLIYDQRHHKATMTLGVEDINQVVTPVEEHQDMWFPLETVSYAHAIIIGHSMLTLALQGAHQMDRTDQSWQSLH